jgi:hypothetical protein
MDIGGVGSMEGGGVVRGELLRSGDSKIVPPSCDLGSANDV